MNSKTYWKLRKRMLSILFKFKTIIYRSISIISIPKDYAPFSLVIAKKAILGLIKGIIIALFLLFLDGILLEAECLAKIDGSIFTAVVIGCLSIAGVILGLYCANISSIYSSKYANAPAAVSNAFQCDRLTQRCISVIIDYIIFGFIVIVEILIDCSLSLRTVFTIILWSIVVIISYSVAGNRAYQLADVYSVADDSYRLLYRIISNNLNKKIYSNDASFQNHFQKICENQFKLLNEIQRFGESLAENNIATMIQFMCKNLALVEAYWEIKRYIPRDSYWFRNTQKYQKWHLTDSIETSTALRTGTILPSKAEHDYWWFENEIFSINRKCILYLCKTSNYSSLYTYLSCFDTICEIAINSKEVNYFVNQINYLRELVEKLATDIEKQDDEENKIFAGIVEQISLLYLGIVLESKKYCENLDIKKFISNAISIIDKGKPLDKCELFRGKEQLDFYNKIITEIQVEKKRLTPDWLIAQNVAKEAHVYINSLIDAIREGIDNSFRLGQYLYEKKMLFESCIISLRFYEYESKLSRLLEVIELKEKEFSEYHIDQALVWDELKIEILKQTIKKWKNTIPSLLLKCSSEFSIKTWEKRDEYPDFLGESYNHICDDAINAITQNNISQFQVDFENLSRLMLLYQEYIRTDFIKKKDVYKIEFVYYAFTSPIAEWAQIGGLAILWGEFNSNKDWKEIVNTVTAKIFTDDSEGTELAETFIKYIQDRDKSWIGFGYRGFLETEWKQRVAQAIKNSEIYQTEYDLFGMKLKTESKLLNAFCQNFESMGFITDPSEVYWVLCINPMLPEEKKFRTRYSWEDKLNV
ncbi:MAG: type II restriction endonuclease subunit M [Lachnospiraceae bacterium]